MPTLIARKSASRYSLFPTVIENLLFWNSWNIKICQVQSTFLQQSSIILLFFKSRFKLFFSFSPSAGYQNMQSWKSNSWTRQILFIDHCQKLWLLRRRKVHKREATMREWLALLRFKGRKKMMMKTSQALCYFQMWKRTLILSLSHFSCPAINLQMSSQRSRSKAMNNQAEKVAQSKLNYR